MATVHPLSALKEAIRARLAADAGVTGFLAGNKVFDEAPRGDPAPLAVFGEAVVKDASGTGSRSHDIQLALTLKARRGESTAALAAAAAIEGLLDDAALPLAGHHLVSLAVVETRLRGTDRDGWSVTLKLRAFVEAA
jgi:hypothetical protein